MTDSLPVMTVRDLTKSFGDLRAVDGVSFDLYPGEVHGFIGPNGAGKTTTMRIMAGVEVPDSGRIFLDGVSMIGSPDISRGRIGFMPDYLDSYPHIQVGEYLDFFARLYGQKPPQRRRRLADVAAFTGLSDTLKRKVGELSKGWKQRLSLARVLLNDPTVLILDEPAAGLDPRARIELRDLVTLLAQNGKAVFISSHILSELSEMCRSVTIIEDGRVVASDMVGRLGHSVDRGVRMTVALAEPSVEECAKLARYLAQVAGVRDVEQAENGARFMLRGDPVKKAEVLNQLVADGFRVADFHSTASSLEETFIVMTGGGR